MSVQVGDPVPAFVLRDQHGRPHALPVPAGTDQRPPDGAPGPALAVVFFPFAFSDVCSSELATLEARRSELVGDRTSLVAVSCDPVFALRAMAEADGLTLPLLSDFWPHGAVAEAFGVLDEDRGCARRSTFVVAADGHVSWVVHADLATSRDVDALVVALASAGGGPHAAPD